jgi:hypothetical protein
MQNRAADFVFSEEGDNFGCCSCAVDRHHYRDLRCTGKYVGEHLSLAVEVTGPPVEPDFPHEGKSRQKGFEPFSAVSVEAFPVAWMHADAPDEVWVAAVRHSGGLGQAAGDREDHCSVEVAYLGGGHVGSDVRVGVDRRKLRGGHGRVP